MSRKLNVGAGGDIRPAEDGWTNMDVIALPGIGLVHDFLEFPWPLADGSVDHILCKHVVEHIPHHVGGRPHKDGFFRFFEECHRILAPGGTVEVFVPHADHETAIADPTHTRFIHPGNFAYLDPANPAKYNYYTTARFRTLVNEISLREPVASGRLRLGKSRLPLTQHLAIRLPFLERALSRPAELHVVLQKA